MRKSAKKKVQKPPFPTTAKYKTNKYRAHVQGPNIKRKQEKPFNNPFV